jgi:uncharacterized protein (DUF1330 family)
MPAYLIGDVEVIDAVDYETYRRQVPATLEAYGGRYLARGGAVEPLEGGRAPDRCVVIVFDDMAALKRWWDSPEYLPLRAVRERSARSRIFATEGL